MELDRIILLLLLLYMLLQTCMSQIHNCSDAGYEGLECLSDIIRNISCVWNQPYVSANTTCTLHGSFTAGKRKYSTNCLMLPNDISDGAVRSCSLVFNGSVFRSFQLISIQIKCNSIKDSLISLKYKPADHVKLSPPGLPVTNMTTIFWDLVPHDRIKQHKFQIQWKKMDQSWEEALLWSPMEAQCTDSCHVSLRQEWHEPGERYQARVRVQADTQGHKSTWSDWSPTASWTSPIAAKISHSPNGSDALKWDSVVCLIVGVLVALSLAAFFHTAHRRLMKISDPCQPNSAMLFQREGNSQAWLNPKLPNSYIHILEKVEISPVEITGVVDAVAPCGLESVLQEKKGWGIQGQSNRSGFFNLSYSSADNPPFSSLLVGNLEPCSDDSPYAPPEGNSASVQSGKQEEENEQGADTQIQCISGAPIFDSERVEKLQAQRCQLQSPDSGMGCVEEEQISLDSVEETHTITEGGGQLILGKDRKAERMVDMGCLHLSSISWAINRSSIQVSSDSKNMGDLNHPLCNQIQCPDSVMIGGEAESLSQDSVVEADRLNETDRDGEEVARETDRGKMESGIFVPEKGCILVSSNYEKIENTIRSEDCRVSTQEFNITNVEEEHASNIWENVVLLPKPKTLQSTDTSSMHSGSFFKPFSFSDLNTSLSLRHIPGILEEIPFLSSAVPILPSSDGYKPVKELQN